MSEKRKQRRTATGIVRGNPKDKTITVESVRMAPHPKYRRYVRHATKYKVHDEKQEAGSGDMVEVMESRPLSKTKHWRLVRVISRHGEKGSEGGS